MRAPVRVLEQAGVRGVAREAEGRERRRCRLGRHRVGRGSSGAPTSALGKKTFASAGCGGCHTFKPAGTDAQVGPDLDNVAADAQKAGEPVADYVRQSIVDPNAVVAAGYQPGVMPPTFGDTLSPEELDALVAYLSGKEAK